MTSGIGQTLTITFRADPDGTDGNDPDNFQCPAGFVGLVIDPDGGVEGPQPPEPPEPTEGVKPDMRITLNAGGGSGGLRHRSASLVAAEGPRTELSIRFHGLTETEKCHEWANNICWRPAPLDYLNLVVTKVIYRGVYETDEALPTLSGSYDEEAGTITLNEVESGTGDEEGEEGEGGGGVKPSVRVMWPTGDLSEYLRLAYHSVNSWFYLDYRWRNPSLPQPPPEEFPPLWIFGPILPGDTTTPMGTPVYGWRIPVRFTLTEGLIDPAPTVDATGSLYQEFTSAQDAFKPTNGQNFSVIVAEVAAPGEEPTAPGVDFNEQGLNSWVAAEGPLEATEYTLLMEILPAYGRFEVTGKYLCGEQVRDLIGRYFFQRYASDMFNAPLIRKPVAYFKIGGIDKIIITYTWGEEDGWDLDTRTALMDPVFGEIGWHRNEGDTDFMYWSGDNTLWGNEYVEIDVKEIYENYGKIPIIIRCRAFWYYIRESGSVMFDIKTYNDEKEIASYSKLVNIVTNIGENVDGDDIGEFTVTAAGKIISG